MFEYDASKKFDLLNAVNEETLVKVVRNGRVQEIPRKDIVVGDIVILETGEEIPADGELLEAISLQVNESNLTGEPVINKTIVEADFDEEATYASNLVMRGTTVVDGHGTMRVLHVGDATEIGKVARQSTEDNLCLLYKSISGAGKQITIIIINCITPCIIIRIKRTGNFK